MAWNLTLDELLIMLDVVLNVGGKLGSKISSSPRRTEWMKNCLLILNSIFELLPGQTFDSLAGLFKLGSMSGYCVCIRIKIARKGQ